MALVLTIAAVTKQWKSGSLTISQTANGRATASFSVVSADESYRPAIDAEVLFIEDGTRIFGGLIDRPRERGIVVGVDGIVTSVNVVDFNVYTEWRYVNETIPAGTLKAALTTLVNNYLDDYGVTLHGSQVDGPTLPELTYEYRQLSDVLNELVTLTADSGQPYVWSIDPFKVLRMYQPSTTSAPFNITSDNPPELFGDIEVESSRDGYANRIIVRVPTKTEFDRRETFTGDGVTTTFQLQYTVLKHYGHILVGSGGGETFGLAADGGQWTLDPDANTITRNVGPTVNGETYILQFDGSYTGLGIAEDAGEIASVGLRERVIQIENVPTDTTAQAIADGELAKRLIVAKRAQYKTFETGLKPGQSQTINLPRRNINVTAVLSDVVIRDLADTRIMRTVTAVVDNAQTNVGSGWRDTIKQWSNDKSGSSAALAVSSSGTPTNAAPGGIEGSVQYRKSNAFGGSVDFIFDEDTNSLTMGTSCTITAVNPDSCMALGYDCHVTD